MLRAVRLLLTAVRSNLPLIATNWTPIRSLIWTPLKRIDECCCMLLIPSPGILTLYIFEKLTIFAFTILLLAEFGFLGDIVSIEEQTAFFCGFLFSLVCSLLVNRLAIFTWFKRVIICYVFSWIWTNNQMINSHTLYLLKL